MWFTCTSKTQQPSLIKSQGSKLWFNNMLNELQDWLEMLNAYLDRNCYVTLSISSYNIVTYEKMQQTGH